MAVVGPSITCSYVDITKYPSVPSQEDREKIFVIGDLHGCALKAFYVALLSGAVLQSKEDYKRFVDIYCAPSKKWTKEIIAEYKAIISRLKKNDQLKRTICLIGDTFADRGENDHPTLLFYQQLKTINVPFSILLSNHDLEFIYRMENGNLEDRHIIWNGEFVQSLNNLHDLIKRDLVSLDEVKKIYEEAYRPALKLLDYYYHEDGIAIMSHAQIDFDVIKLLAKKFNVNYQDESPAKLGATIDEINKKFQECAEKNEIHKLVNRKADDRDSKPPSAESDPVLFTLWNRKAVNENALGKNMPYPVWFVHGHYELSRRYNNVFNLDENNNVGDTNFALSRIGCIPHIWLDKVSPRPVEKWRTFVPNHARMGQAYGQKNIKSVEDKVLKRLKYLDLAKR